MFNKVNIDHLFIGHKLSQFSHIYLKSSPMFVVSLFSLSLVLSLSLMTSKTEMMAKKSFV